MKLGWSVYKSEKSLAINGCVNAKHLHYCYRLELVKTHNSELEGQGIHDKLVSYFTLGTTLKFLTLLISQY